jgi:peptide/nickel transport system permease protein
MMVRGFGIAVVGAAVLAAVAAPLLAPHGTDDRFPELLNAPPTFPRVIDRSGNWRLPFVYPWKLVNRLEQRYERDSSRSAALVWFRAGRLVGSSNDAHAPLLLLGTDSYGRDVFSRLLYGARVSIGLSLVAAVGAILIGGLVGAFAGYVGGATDDVMMRATDMVMVLPAMYVVLALRSVLPLVLSASAVFLFLAAIFSVVGAPHVARGVRGIVRTERRLEYALAAVSLGAGPARLLARHLLPATTGFIAVETTVLVPAFIVAEATLSYVGLGFPESVASWGTMLHEASNVRTFADFPWLLSPAAAMFFLVLGLNFLLQRPAIDPVTISENESFRRSRSDSDTL